jgi:hypothetical protein
MIIIGTVSRRECSEFDRFSARFAMPAGTASEIRHTLSERTFERLLAGLRVRGISKSAAAEGDGKASQTQRYLLHQKQNPATGKVTGF